MLNVRSWSGRFILILFFGVSWAKLYTVCKEHVGTYIRFSEALLHMVCYGLCDDTLLITHRSFTGDFDMSWHTSVFSSNKERERTYIHCVVIPSYAMHITDICTMIHSIFLLEVHIDINDVTMEQIPWSKVIWTSSEMKLFISIKFNRETYVNILKRERMLKLQPN